MEFVVPHEVEAFREESDGDLLAYMALRSDDPETATVAYAAFYTRHIRWLYAVLMRQECQHLLGGPEAVAEFAQETFQRAFDAAPTFDANGITDADTLRKRTRAWLGRIGRHLMLDAVRAGAPGHFEEFGEPDDYATPDDAQPASEEVEVMESLLEELPAREKDVVLDWTMYYKPGVTHQRLSNEASASLARRWRTTPAHIRVIRKRTFDKLREAVTTELARRSGRL